MTLDELCKVFNVQRKKFIPCKDLWKEKLHLCRDLTLAGIGAPLGYHMGESFLQCPHSVFWKNAIWLWAVWANQTPETTDKAYDYRSSDALGKALMAGIESGNPADAVSHYESIIATDEMTVADVNLMSALERELSQRVTLILKKIYALNPTEVEFERKFEWTAPPRGDKPALTYNGAADIVVHAPLGPFIIEVKNTDNPGWIINHSGQVDYYCRLGRATGFTTGGGYYYLLPGWLHGNINGSFGGINHAYSVQSEPAHDGSATPYIRAINTLAEIPLNPDLWALPDKYINRCKTCQARRYCYPQGLPTGY